MPRCRCWAGVRPRGHLGSQSQVTGASHAPAPAPARPRPALGGGGQGGCSTPASPSDTSPTSRPEPGREAWAIQVFSPVASGPGGASTNQEKPGKCPLHSEVPRLLSDSWEQRPRHVLPVSVPAQGRPASAAPALGWCAGDPCRHSRPVRTHRPRGVRQQHKQPSGRTAHAFKNRPSSRENLQGAVSLQMRAAAERGRHGGSSLRGSLPSGLDRSRAQAVSPAALPTCPVSAQLRSQYENRRKVGKSTHRPCSGPRADGISHQRTRHQLSRAGAQGVEAGWRVP